MRVFFFVNHLGFSSPYLCYVVLFSFIPDFSFSLVAFPWKKKHCLMFIFHYLLLFFIFFQIDFIFSLPLSFSFQFDFVIPFFPSSSQLYFLLLYGLYTFIHFYICFKFPFFRLSLFSNSFSSFIQCGFPFLFLSSSHFSIHD